MRVMTSPECLMTPKAIPSKKAWTPSALSMITSEQQVLFFFIATFWGFKLKGTLELVLVMTLIRLAALVGLVQPF